jgi:hypothetical protein
LVELASNTFRITLIEWEPFFAVDVAGSCRFPGAGYRLLATGYW